MKKFFAVLLSSFLVLSACGHSDHSDKKIQIRVAQNQNLKSRIKKIQREIKKLIMLKMTLKIVN